MVSSIYLADCNHKIKDYPPMRAIINSLPLSASHDGYDIIPFYYLEASSDCCKILEKLSKSPNIVGNENARINGFLGIFYESKLSKIDLTKKQRDAYVKKSKAALEKATTIYSSILIFNTAYSNILSELELYDEAMIYKMDCYENDSTYSHNHCTVALENCSEDFCDKYPEMLYKKLIISDKIREYIEADLSSDISHYWSNSNYIKICEVFDHFETHILDALKPLEKNEYIFYGDSVAFRIAYSLAEAEKAADAIRVYEALLETEDDNSSALNNLAILYEKEADLLKAEVIISKAEDVAGDSDDLITRNAKRIRAKMDSNDTSANDDERSAESSRMPEKHTYHSFHFDEDDSCLYISKYRLEVSSGSLTHPCLVAIFNRSSDELRDEIFFSEIGEVIDPVERPSDKKVYNWVDRIKKYIAVETGIKDAITTTTHTMKINEKYLE